MLIFQKPRLQRIARAKGLMGWMSVRRHDGSGFDSSCPMVATKLMVEMPSTDVMRVTRRTGKIETPTRAILSVSTQSKWSGLSSKGLMVMGTRRLLARGVLMPFVGAD